MTSLEGSEQLISQPEAQDQWQADRNSSKDLGNFLRIHCLLNFHKKRLSSGFHISQVWCDVRYFKILLNLQIPLMLTDLLDVFVFCPDFIFLTLRYAAVISQSCVVIVLSSISEDDITPAMSANSIPPPALQTTKALSFERTETESLSLVSDSLSLDSTVTLGTRSTNVTKPPLVSC